MKLRTLSRREWMVTVLAIMMGLIYVGKGMLFKNPSPQVSRADIRTLELARQLRKSQDMIKQQKASEDVRASFLKNFMQTSSDAEEMSRFVSQLQLLANQASLRTIEIKPAAIKGGPYYQTLSVNLSLEGTLPNLTSFLFNAQSAPQYFGVENMQIDKSPTQAGFIQCRIEIYRIMTPKTD